MLTRLRPGQWALAAVLIVAAVLRFQHLDAIQHNVDHAYPIWQAMMTLDRGVFPTTAQGTSVLFANPPLTGYLFIPWVMITRSPIGPYVFVILLNTFAVYLAYRAAALILDEHRALIAAFLMAINPYVVEYSRATWVQALMPFFACLLFWLLVPILLGKAAHPRRRLILAAIALSAMAESYLLAFVMIVPVGLLLIIFRKRLALRPILIGAAIFVIPALIYGAGLLANGADTAARIRDFATGGSHLSSEAWSHAVRLISGENYAVVRGMDAPITDSVLREYLSLAAHYVILVATLAGIAACVYAIVKLRDPAALIVVLWFALPILLMSYVSKPVHPFYLLLTLPAGYLLAAWTLDKLFKRRIITPLLVVFLAFIGVLFSINIVRFSENTLHLPGTYQLGALPVGPGMQMMRQLLPARLNDGEVVFADVDEWTLNSLAGKLFPVDRSVDTSLTTYAPVGGAIYLLSTPTAGSPSTSPAWATDPADFAFDDGFTVQRSIVLPTVAATLPGTPIPGDKGMSYLGGQIVTPPHAGSSAVLLTYWRVDALPPERGIWLFGPFVHVFDAAGKRVAIGDGGVVPGNKWRLGDVQIQRISVAIPADAVGPFTLQVGQYDGMRSQNMIFKLLDSTFSPTIVVP